MEIKFDLKKQETYHKDAYSVVNADNSHLKQLGWKPTVPVEEGLRRMIEWAENDDYFKNW